MMITAMNRQHVSQVAELEKLCFSDPWSESSIAHELENPLSIWLVAEEDDLVVGYVGSQTVLDESDMMNSAISPDHRRKGYAQALVENLIAALAQRGSRCLTLEVRTSNTPAISLYTSLGFEQVGLPKHYYRNPKEDALILRKEWSL